MGFAAGSVSFRRFAVVGQQPERVDDALLERLAVHALRPGELGVPDEVEYGWSGGRHVLDDQFDLEHNAFADALFFGLRIDTNRVPSGIRQAYTLMEEAALAAGNPSGFISKAQKKEAKETVRRKMEDELRDGRYRRSKLVPLLWDLPTATLHASVSGKSQEILLEIFERTFGLALAPLSAGATALRWLEPRGGRRDYEDIRPTRFVPGPEGEGQYPEYPWVAKGPEPKDFLGNEFLLWLWHEADRHDGSIALESAAGGAGGRGKEASVFIDRWLDLDCAYGQSGRDSLRGTGPGRMPEARDALRTGKVPRRAGLMLHVDGEDYVLTLAGESFGVGGAKLPEVEDAQTARVLFEERIGLIRNLNAAIDGLFAAFLAVRASSAWEGQVGKLRRWITAPSGAVAAA